MTNVIDALKRLERAGSDQSVASQKLCQAAAVLTEHICSIVSESAGIIEVLPVAVSHRGLTVWEAVDESGEHFPEGAGHNPSLWFARQLAGAVAAGLLGKLATHLEALTASHETEAATLASASAERVEYVELSGDQWRAWYRGWAVPSEEATPPDPVPLAAVLVRVYPNGAVFAGDSVTVWQTQVAEPGGVIDVSPATSWADYRSDLLAAGGHVGHIPV